MMKKFLVLTPIVLLASCSTDVKEIEIKKTHQIETPKIEERKQEEIIEKHKNTYETNITISEPTVPIVKEEKIVEKTSDNSIKWFKDELFTHRWTIEERHNGNWRLIEYSQKIDVEDRDEIDVDKVFDKYIDLRTLNFTKEKSLTSNFKYNEVTEDNVKNEDKEWVVLYFHWMGWNKDQWTNNHTFWWNFNRIQNLMLENKGSYITTTLTWTKENTENHIALIEKLRKEYPNAKIIVSCGSKWWEMLWNLIDSRVNKDLFWVIFMWSVLDMKWRYSPLYQQNIPVYISHWTKDHIPYEEKEQFLKAMTSKGVKMKVDIFNTGIHWTPIRMTDWKEVLNWFNSLK